MIKNEFGKRKKKVSFDLKGANSQVRLKRKYLWNEKVINSKFGINSKYIHAKPNPVRDPKSNPKYHVFDAD